MSDTIKIILFIYVFGLSINALLTLLIYLDDGSDFASWRVRAIILWPIHLIAKYIIAEHD